MKKLICLLIAFLLVIGTVLCGCSPAFDKTPAEYEDVKWVTPDYSFRFNTADDCKGNYNFSDKKYSIQVEFDNTRIIVNDIDKGEELFSGLWSYEDKDYLFVYDIQYNTSEYEEFENNYSEFYRLHQEKLS